MIDVVNTTPHPIKFWKPGWEEPIVVQPCGTVIKADIIEEPMGMHPSGAKFVRIRFIAPQESSEALARLERENMGSVIVGTSMAVKAFNGRIFSTVPAPGYEDAPPEEQRMLPDKFATF